MAGREFLFALHLSDASQSDDMPGQLAGSILRYVGCGATSAGRVLGRLNGIVASAGVGGCGVQFRAERGELQIVISTADGRVSHLRCALH